jgi:hypothetical protein
MSSACKLCHCVKLNEASQDLPRWARVDQRLIRGFSAIALRRSAAEIRQRASGTPGRATALASIITCNPRGGESVMEASHERSGQAGRPSSNAAGTNGRHLLKTKRGDLEQSMDPARSRRSRRLGRDSRNHRREQLMVHLAPGSVRERGDRSVEVPDFFSQPSRCEFGVV